MNDITSNWSRREMLSRCGMGMGMLALADLARGETIGDGAQSDLALLRQQPHFEPKAKQVVHLFMNGGPSHVDTFDPKPLLTKYHGKPLPNPALPTERKTAGALGSPFKFQKYGQSGIEVSELFSRTAEHADDLCVIRSMHADIPNHEPSLMLMNCGDNTLPRPSFGSWVNYGLGTLNQNLPGFVVLCPNGFPVVGPKNWRSAFLPGAFQGTHIDTKQTRVSALVENITNPQAPERQRRQLDLLQRMNSRHLDARGHDANLEARIQSYELAYRMQFEASDVFDLSKEPKHIHDMYGDGLQGRQLMITRRLLERGVRFVQAWHSGGQEWDNHSAIEASLRRLCGMWDQPIAAFLTDLKQRGMLDSTLVLWGGEFGRTPVAELPAMDGRDHNHYGFSVWMAGGGVKGGHVHGATDETGFAAAEKKVHVHDLHATMLHLLGLDHERLTYRYAGRDFRLTDVHGHVVDEIIS
ncbi:MAG: sulfatase [Planctomyces sp.]|nr:sulfatase [Planctomyces sp.]